MSDRRRDLAWRHHDMLAMPDPGRLLHGLDIMFAADTAGLRQSRRGVAWGAHAVRRLSGAASVSKRFTLCTESRRTGEFHGWDIRTKRGLPALGEFQWRGWAD